MIPPSPETIGPFRVLRPIASGGSAVVYQVQNPRSGEHLALKLLLEDGAARSRFDREYEAMIRLNHPSIVHVYQYGEHGSAPWFTMELVQGTPVQAYARNLGKPGSDVRMREVVRIGRDIALALDHIHYRGLVHRDLKSANVLVLPDGRIKLIDFGTARVRDALEQITRENEFVGTFAYAAPEQIRNDGVGAHSDLYSLGVLLYRLCTGKRPFDAPDIRELARKQLQEDPRPPRELVPSIPEYLERIILALLHKDPTQRPARGRTVATSLDKVFDEQLEPPGGLAVTGEAMVGREEQLVDLRRGLLRRKPGSLLLVTGPRGSGRRRLLLALAKEAKADGWKVLHADAAEGEDEQILAMLWEIGHGFGRSARSSRVLRALRVLDTIESNQRLSAARRDEAVILAGSALLGEWSTQVEQPALVVLTSMHLASATTHALVEAARSETASGPNPVVFAVGLEGLPGQLDRPSLAHATTVELQPLGTRETALLTGALLHRRPPPNAIARRIQRASGGLPAYVVEVIEGMLGTGSLRARGRAMERLEWARQTLEIPVPRGARSVILDDLSLLPVEFRRVLEALALAGGEAQPEVLAHALNRTPGELSEIVAHLVADNWVRFDETGSATWSRGLVEAVVLEQLHDCRRNVLQRRLAESMDETSASLPVLAGLLVATGEIEQAVALALDHGQELLGMDQAETAIELLEPLVQLMESKVELEPVIQGRLWLLYASALLLARPADGATGKAIARASSLAGDALSAEASFARARLQRTIGHYPNYRKLLLEGWRAMDADADPTTATRLARHLAQDSLMAGDPERTEYWYRTARELALRSEDPLVRAMGDLGVAAWLYSRGSLRDAEAWSAGTARILQEHGHTWGLARARVVWSNSLRQQGRFSEALDALDELLPELAQGQSLSGYLQLLMAAAWCEVDLCRLGSAQEYVDELTATLRRGEYLHLRLQADLVRGRILVASGLVEDAEPMLRAVVSRGEAAGLTLLCEHARALRAEALWNLDQHREAADAFALSTRRLARAGNVPVLMEACAAQARVMAADLDPERIFALVGLYLQGQPFYPTRLERILARAWYQAARGGEPRGALRAAELQLEQIRSRLAPTEAAALRLHPWLRRIRKGGLP